MLNTNTDKSGAAALIMAAMVMLSAGAWAGAAPAADAAATDVVHTNEADRAMARLAESITTTKHDIERASGEFNDLRARIAKERIPLARQIETLQAEVRLLRETARRQDALRRQGEMAHQALREEVQAMEDECRFVQTVLSEYRRSMGTRAGMAETAMLEPDLRPIDRLLSEQDEPGNLPRAAQLLLDLAARWTRRNLGGTVFDGACLSPGGMELAGRFAVLGPVAYFADREGRQAGLAMTRLGSTMPSLFAQLEPEQCAAIRDLVDGKPATVPLDVSAGNAVKIRAARKSIVARLKAGGVVMIPLAAVGLTALVLAVWKAVALSRLRTHSAGAVDAIVAALKSNDKASAQDQAAALGEPLASIIREGIEHAAAPREHLEEILNEHAMAKLPLLERHLGALAVLGGVAPLLGLLGTVTGMIHTFQLVTLFGTGDAKLLSSGISEALVTTETGLAIAIPVLLVQAYLSRRVRTVVATLEQTIASFVNRLKVEG